MVLLRFTAPPGLGAHTPCICFSKQDAIPKLKTNQDPHLFTTQSRILVVVGPVVNRPRMHSAGSSKHFSSMVSNQAQEMERGNR